MVSMMVNAFVNVYWRAVCGESRMHGSEGGSWKSALANSRLGNSLAAYPTASEYDPDNGIFFGLVSGFEVELGYFSLSELQSIGGGLQLPIERDLHYTPKTLRELKEMHEKERRI